MSELDKSKVERSYLKRYPNPIIDGYDNKVEVVDPSALNTLLSITKHRKSVKNKLNYIADKIKNRAEHHDDSKLQYPEFDWLVQMDKEPRCPYGTPEYYEKMKRWQKFFDHHYARNRHHPDHFPNKVDGMTLVDLCEYCIDIISYYDEMHASDAINTINSQSTRFGLDEQVMSILKNTLLEYFAWMGDYRPRYEEEKESEEKNQDNR